MPRGPQGQKRPADVIGNVVTTARVVTGEIKETGYEQPGKVRAGEAGGAARRRVPSPGYRQKISNLAVTACWSTDGA